MKDVAYLDRLDQAETLLKPQRLTILRELAVPRTCTEVAARLDQSSQRIYYHVKRLEAAGLVRLVAERKVRGLTEGLYQATARKYWVSPAIVSEIQGAARSGDDHNLAQLLDLSEQVQRDIATLDPDAARLPSIGISGDVRVRPEQREEFMLALRESLQELFTRFGGAEGDAFKLAVACYPASAGAS
ncbi:helix-turn-helix domain-containing protein [Agromyces sp. CFH 90414]|uniref:Helix-turn-helix domain-containing protein n=1 Tax=Agromyces agglutinans TaxID=2662258 RepID=A0A6I2F1Q4_9MICO|nr:helix-turn-helix domain-containing protein [Agromyces agglutinans]MRG58402.1 helix-turn-helix domain-containing protein [Agromyces agglutinans]